VGASGTSGTSGTASNWSVQTISSSFTYYPTFVDANNASPTIESGWTNAGLTYIPNSKRLFSGTAAAGTGSSTAPSFEFFDYSTTGISNPFADQLTLITTGTGALLINATGTVVFGDDTLSGGLNFGGYGSTVTTTTTITNVVTIDPPYPAYVYVEGWLSGYKSASPQNSGGAFARAIFENTTGTWTIVQTAANILTRSSTGFTITAYLEVTGNVIALRARGAAGVTSNWVGRLTWFGMTGTAIV
jgi:hypothetical protein